MIEVIRKNKFKIMMFLKDGSTQVEDVETWATLSQFCEHFRRTLESETEDAEKVLEVRIEEV